MMYMQRTTMKDDDCNTCREIVQHILFVHLALWVRAIFARVRNNVPPK